MADPVVILTPEQVNQPADFQAVSLEKPLKWTYTFVPDEQPERGIGKPCNWYWNGQEWADETDLKHALVRYWWQEYNKNEGEPPTRVSDAEAIDCAARIIGRFEAHHRGEIPLTLGMIEQLSLVGQMLRGDSVPVTLYGDGWVGDLGTGRKNLGPALLLRAWGEQGTQPDLSLHDGGGQGEIAIVPQFRVRFELQECPDAD